MKKLNKKGFTIVELVIVIAVIGVLAGVLIPTFGGVIASANASAALQTARGCLSTALNMSSTGALPGKTTGGKYRTAFFVDQTGDGKIDYAFGYTGNELVTEDPNDIKNRLEVNSILMASEFIICNQYTASGETTAYTVDQKWYELDGNGGKTKVAKGHLDNTASNLIDSSLLWTNEWQAKTVGTYSASDSECIIQDDTNGIKYVITLADGARTAMYGAAPADPAEDKRSETADIFVNSDLSKKVVIFTYFN